MQQQPQPVMMGYRMQQPSYAAGYPGQIYMMGAAGRDAHMASPVSNRFPHPTSEPNFAGGAAAGRMSSGDAVAAAQSNAAAAAAAMPSGGTSKSKQGLEKILDTLSKMFPDVRRSVMIIATS